MLHSLLPYPICTNAYEEVKILNQYPSLHYPYSIQVKLLIVSQLYYNCYYSGMF